ncbi:MAG: hypothetical protein AAGM67_10425, partial [Bacteroidota bacterium]
MLITVLAVVVIAIIVVSVMDQKEKQVTLRDIILKATIYLWDVVWGIVSLPWRVFRGLFYSSDASGQRSHFSMTRTMFALASFI